MRRRGIRLAWLWVAFAAANLWVAWLAYTGPGYPLGDVFLYQWWVGLGLDGGPWVGLDTAWVYPVLALLPMTAAAAGGAYFVLAWVVLVVALNLAALLVLVRSHPDSGGLVAGLWWAAFILASGPIIVGRIDSVTIPLVVMAFAVLARRPALAGVLLAVATWMKVWPAAAIAALVLVTRERWRVLLGVTGTSAVIMLAAIALGGGGALFTFVTMQSGRGLQIEAPVSAPWLWMAAGGDQASGLYYDEDILTYQVYGPGVDVVAGIMTPLLAAVALAIVGLALWLLGRGARPSALLPPLVLALVTALILVNKVGSPQFIGWLAAPIVLGIISARRQVGSYRLPAVLVLVIALLTQAVYPVLYGHLLALEPAMLTVLTVRNILLLALFVIAVRGMFTTARTRRSRVPA